MSEGGKPSKTKSAHIDRNKYVFWSKEGPQMELFRFEEFECKDAVISVKRVKEDEKLTTLEEFSLWYRLGTSASHNISDAQVKQAYLEHLDAVNRIAHESAKPQYKPKFLGFSTATSKPVLPRRKKGTLASPPKKALSSIYFFLPKDIREFLVGDICEDFPKQVERMGPRGAKAWVWKECVFAIGNAALDWGISKFRALGGILRIGGEG